MASSRRYNFFFLEGSAIVGSPSCGLCGVSLTDVWRGTHLSYEYYSLLHRCL